MNQAILSEKEALVSQITSQFENSSSAVVCEYRGLSVAEITELRRALRAEDVDLKVYKNTMVQRAVDNLGLNELDEALKGPNAIAFSSDATAPARVLSKFAKTHDKLIIKSGLVEGKVVGLDTLKELASLPNHDGMLSMFLSVLQAPVSAFARVVKAVADAKEDGSFTVQETKAEEAPVAEAAPEEAAPAAEEAKEA